MHTALQLTSLETRTEESRRQGYSQIVRLLVAAVLVSLAVASTAAAAAPSLTLTPSSVRRGHTVLIKGSADGCAAGNTVFILSRAFVHRHDFAGVPAVLAKVRAGGYFRVTTRIPARKRPGRYGVTARCGGGNLGILKHLTVRR
jgi:hypothetical protein